MSVYKQGVPRSQQAAGAFKNVSELLKDVQDLERALNTLGYSLTVNLHISGNGSPEGVLTAPVGTLYSRLNGGTSTTLYVKESGTGNTGWVAK